MSGQVYPVYTHLFMCPNCWPGCERCAGAATTESHIGACEVVEPLRKLAAELDDTTNKVRRAFDLEE